MNAENKIKALIIEDNPTQANMLRISLARRGFDVEVVAYLAHAVERLENGGIDVILLDLSLPDSDGIETFYEIYNRASQVPIVVLSGMNDHAIAQAALEGGAQDYLVKGVPSDESISRCLRYAIERHRFERKIWESERTTRLIVENAQDAFVSMDAQGRLTGWNKKAEMIFGWYRKDIIGKPFIDVLFPENLRNLFFQEIQAFLNGQRGNVINNRIETTLQRHDGSLFPAELAMFPVTVGSVYTLCGFVQDISDRKLVEQRLHHTNLQLEELVNERTGELNETITRLQQFARQTSRDLQEPLISLQSIALNLAKELREVKNPRIDEQIDHILEVANQMVANLQARKDYKVSEVSRSGNELMAPARGNGSANGLYREVGSGRTEISSTGCKANNDKNSIEGRINSSEERHYFGQVSAPASSSPFVEPALPSASHEGSSGALAVTPAGVPPIAQIKLPEQMVPTSNVLPQIINTNPRSTKVLPAIKKTTEGPTITRVLPAVERPAQDPSKKKTN